MEVTPRTYGHFIHGREVPAATGETFPSVAPMTGAVLGWAARGAHDDVERAIASAHQGFASWSARPPYEREKILLKCADQIEAQFDDVLNLLIDESGSTIVKARYEVNYAISVVRAAAGEARRLYADTLQVLIQQQTPAAIRGSVIGFFGLCGAVGILAASKFGGWLFDVWTESGPFVVFGLLSFVLAAWAMFMRNGIRPVRE